MTDDAINISSGAGGATLAHAPTGLRILILERNQYLRRENNTWDAQAVFNAQHVTADPHWLD